MPNDGTGNVEYVRGLKALVARDFPAAAASLAQANAPGLPGTRALLAYGIPPGRRSGDGQAGRARL